MMTKAQEREALQRIQNILADAGPESYIGIAFAGCAEIAAQNIENDWGCSMQEDLQNVKRSRDQLSEARMKSDEKCERLEGQLEKVREELDEANAKLKAARIPESLYKRLWLAVDAQQAEAVAEMARSADLLAELVNAPGDIAVSQCLKTLAKQKARRDEAAALLADLEKLEPKNI